MGTRIDRSEAQHYARARHQATGRHYLMTNEGHVWLDCHDCRALAPLMQLEVIWTTRNTNHHKET